MGLSGGVDSSTALALLHEAGADVFGLTMRIYRPGIADDSVVSDACYGPGEIEDVASSEAFCRSPGYWIISKQSTGRDELQTPVFDATRK